MAIANWPLAKGSNRKSAIANRQSYQPVTKHLAMDSASLR